MSAQAGDWSLLAEKVIEKLLSRIPENKVRPRLEPTRRAVSLLGDPQKNYHVIHITGTNGKTSTTRFIERILRELGLRTGRFTSPHLIKLNERIAIDGEMVEDERLVEVFNDIEPVLDFVDQELIDQGETRLTFFEALAVLAFAIFADAPIDVLVLEVGMGGEWDSTNVADGDVAVFTPIGLDHMERLGNTISEIAQTKSGIIKEGSIVVSGYQVDEALRVLKTVAQQRAERLVIAGKDFSVSSAVPGSSGQLISVSGLAGKYGPYQVPLFGSHQSENLAVAIAAVEAFMGAGQLSISDDVLRTALADVSSPGRLQLIKTDPEILLDAAHNPAGARTLAAALRAEFSDRPLIGLVSILADKDASGIFAELEGVFDQLIFTQSSSPRASMVEELIQLSPTTLAAEPIADFTEAFATANRLAKHCGGLVVVTGSITLVGDVLAKLQEESDAQ